MPPAAAERDPRPKSARSSPGCVGPGEQIPQRSPAPQRQPDPPAVLRPVVEQVAPLAECPDVAVLATAMGRVMVEMRCRQYHLGGPDRRLSQGRRGNPAAPTVPPGLVTLVPPAAIAEMLHHGTLRPATDLAAALGAHEPDPVTDLLPVDRVEVLELGADRHDSARG